MEKEKLKKIYEFMEKHKETVNDIFRDIILTTRVSATEYKSHLNPELLDSIAIVGPEPGLYEESELEELINTGSREEVMLSLQNYGLITPIMFDDDGISEYYYSANIELALAIIPSKINRHSESTFCLDPIVDKNDYSIYNRLLDSFGNRDVEKDKDLIKIDQLVNLVYENKLELYDKLS